MTKNLLKFALLAFMTVAAMAGREPLSPRAESRNDVPVKLNKKATVFKSIAHLAASDDWKSMIILRNDLNREIALSLDIFGADGLPAAAVFYDSDNVEYATDRFDFVLAPFEVYTLEFDRMVDAGLVNLQAFIFSDETDQEYSVEVNFSNFQGLDKVATVGTGLQVPGNNFFMNVDVRNDAYTNNPKIRGLAVTNTAETTCTCTAVMWDHAGNEVASTDVIIGASAKWVGALEGLFNFSLSKGLGLLDFACSQQVAVTGLAFESGTPIVGSTPIDYYTFAKDGKKQRRR